MKLRSLPRCSPPAVRPGWGAGLGTPAIIFMKMLSSGQENGPQVFWMSLPTSSIACHGCISDKYQCTYNALEFTKPFRGHRLGYEDSTILISD